MRRIYLIAAGIAVVLLVALVVGLPPMADQSSAADLQMVVGGVQTQAMATFRLDKTCERGNTRCR